MNQSNWKKVFFCTHSFRILSKLLSVSVHVASKNEKKKGWNHMCWTVIINHLWKNIDKKTSKRNQFFSWKKNSSFLKKKLSTFEMKKFKREILHNYSFIFHHIKFTDVKKEIYFKILSNFLGNIFKSCRGMPLLGHLLAARYDIT